MIKLKNIITEDLSGWTKQKNCEGNPSLGLDSYLKKFKNPHNNRNVPVYIFGTDSENSEYKNDWNFSVSAGPNSEFSYTGGFPLEINTLEKRIRHIEDLYSNGKLFI